MDNVIKKRVGSSKGLTLALGIGAAVLAGLLLLLYLNQYRSSVKEENEQTPVLVAKNLIPAGTSGTIIAEKELFQVASYRKSDLKIGAISDPAFLNGRVAAVDIFPGQQITTADVSTTTTEAFSTKLTGLQRAFAIPVDQTRGLVGFIGDGDRVDVYMSLSDRNGTLLTLLAPNVEILRAPVTGADNVALIRADAALAQKLAFASDETKLWFLLRPAVDAKKPPEITIDRQTLLNQARRNRAVR